MLRIGHANFGGDIQVNLINGFIPDPGLPPSEPPDDFQIITFATSEGAFDSTQIDLGNGLHFDLDYRLNSVVLVTDQDP